MRFTTFLLGLVLLFGLTHSRRVEACGDGGDTGVFVLAGGYLGGTAAFAINDIANRDHSVKYGLGEVAWNGLFGGLWASYLISEDEVPSGGALATPTAFVFLGIHALLVAHGIHTILRAPNPNDAPVQPRKADRAAGAMQLGRVTAVVTPTPIHDGAGFGLSGTF